MVQQPIPPARGVRSVLPQPPNAPRTPARSRSDRSRRPLLPGSDCRRCSSRPRRAAALRACTPPRPRPPRLIAAVTRAMWPVNTSGSNSTFGFMDGANKPTPLIMKSTPTVSTAMSARPMAMFTCYFTPRFFLKNAIVFGHASFEAARFAAIDSGGVCPVTGSSCARMNP